eukprot:5025980-Pleurochrysis_carterae.AAC.1
MLSIAASPVRRSEASLPSCMPAGRPSDDAACAACRCLNYLLTWRQGARRKALSPQVPTGLLSCTQSLEDRSLSPSLPLSLSLSLSLSRALGLTATRVLSGLARALSLGAGRARRAGASLLGQAGARKGERRTADRVPIGGGGFDCIRRGTQDALVSCRGYREATAVI